MSDYVENDRSNLAQLYQPFPKWTRNSAYPLKSFTDTVQGYINEGRKYVRSLIYNQTFRPVEWYVVISLGQEMTVAEIKTTWSKITRGLRRRGLVAHWIAEPTGTAGKIHYNLLVASLHSLPELRKIVTDSIGDILARVSIDPVTKPDMLFHYCYKIPYRGKDQWKSKRRLFCPFVHKKCGTIGDFWHPETTLWENQCRDFEKLVFKNSNMVKNAAVLACDLVGGYVPLKQVVRRFAANLSSSGVQSWMNEAMRKEYYLDELD